MAKYNPFAERTGMTKIAEQPRAKKALKIAETLRMMGFIITFLGSKRYVLKKILSLKTEDLQKVREAFKENVHPHFMKEFFIINPTEKPSFSKKKLRVQILTSLQN